MRSVSDPRALAAVAALGLGGCATSAPPLPPTDPSRLLSARPVAPPASAASPWGEAPPEPVPHARVLDLRTTTPTVTERYWQWTLVGDLSSLAIFTLGLSLTDDYGSRLGYMALASLPAGAIHVAYGRPLAALAAVSVRSLGFVGGVALIEGSLGDRSAVGRFGSAFLGATLIGACISLGAGLDATVLARREVPIAGWRRLPVLPAVSATPTGWQLGVGGDFR